METIGDRIRILRTAVDISQEELAFKLDVTRQTVHKWENNAARPSTDNIAALCRFFKVKPQFFFDEDETASAEDEPAQDGEKESPVEAAEGATGQPAAVGKDKRFTVRVALLAVFSVAFVVFAALSVWSGFTAFSSNTGIDQTSTSQLTVPMFICFVLLAAGFLTAAIISLFFVIRLKCKPKFT